jgi:hypothetical protein
VFKEKIKEINNEKITKDSLIFNDSVIKYDVNDTIYRDSIYLDTILKNK